MARFETVLNGGVLVWYPLKINFDQGSHPVASATQFDRFHWLTEPASNDWGYCFRPVCGGIPNKVAITTTGILMG